MFDLCLLARKDIEMSKIRTFFRLLASDRKTLYQALIYNISKSKVSHLIPDRLFLKIQYKSIFGRKLDLNNPKSFNEKLQWLKLYDRKKQYMQMVDKSQVKDLISEELGSDHVISTLGQWKRFEDIDFESLPNEFVLKCTHDSGSTIICKDKSVFNFDTAKEKLAKKLKTNLFWHGREWPYKFLVPTIIAEEYISSDGEAPNDYKFFCFNGKVKCFKVDFDRFTEHKANYYTLSGELLPFGEKVCAPDYERKIAPPKNLAKMIEYAEKLSQDIPFLRVDFYEVNDKIFFGELTFFPASGFGPFVPEEWDEKIGSWLKLPEV